MSTKESRMIFKIIESPTKKICRSENYNFIFDKRTGFFARWGKTENDDPLYSPIGPEILDLEISVNGCPNKCPFCYKGNTNDPPTNMSFDAFKTIFHKVGPQLTQIAFGITGVQTNPDFIKMMRYCREHGVVPNFTLTGIDLTDEIAKEIAELVGGLAVSCYSWCKDVGYNTIEKFTNLGVKQTNMHLMVSAETIDFVYEVLKDRIKDPRLSKMNAIIFLGVKPKGRAKNGYHSLPTSDYKRLVEWCLDHNIMFGFDSCSAPKFEQTVQQLNIPDEKKQSMIMASESCESSLFSAYINVEGKYWHCSFCEDENEPQYVDVLAAEDFLRDVWYSDQVKKFRAKSIATMKQGYRECTIFPEINV